MTVPPYSLEAEESLLGAMLLQRSARDDAEALVQPDDFYKPAHAVLYETILTLHGQGISPDPVTVAEHLKRIGELEKVGGRQRLLELQAQTPASANAAHYARIVIETAAKRRLIGAAGKISEIGYDSDIDPVTSVMRAQELIAAAEIPIGGQPSPNVSQFLSHRVEHHWLWPGILETMERLLLVAPEKYGKSTMIRQIAVCLSQGLDPFRLHTIPHVLVHLIDLENPEVMVQRKLGEMYDATNTLERSAIPEMLRIDCRPDGIDIANSRADLLWLQERIAANRADWQRQGFELDYPMVVCIGPIYKMLEDELSLPEVRRLQAALDKIRKRFKCALIMETHAPHESFNPKNDAHSLRPAGPRVWLRWPEFCRAFEPSNSIAAIGDQRVADFYDCMGARDERAWPRRLRRGSKYPWVDDDAKF